MKGVISLICAVRERTVRCKEGNTAAVARLELVMHVKKLPAAPDNRLSISNADEFVIYIMQN